MNIKQCSICSAQWIDGQHYWTGTNKKVNENQEDDDDDEEERWEKEQIRKGVLS